MQDTTEGRSWRFRDELDEPEPPRSWYPMLAQDLTRGMWVRLDPADPPSRVLGLDVVTHGTEVRLRLSHGRPPADADGVVSIGFSDADTHHLLPADQRVELGQAVGAIDAQATLDTAGHAREWLEAQLDAPIPASDGLLTPQEHAVVSLLSAATRGFVATTRDAMEDHGGRSPDDPQTAAEALAWGLGRILPPALGDVDEWIHHCHTLQNMLLSRAAGRAYPGMYRL